jgi:hypothetical protein
MKASFLSLALCLLTLGAASAQTAPATRPAPPATMAAPNTERSDMSDAAKGVGTPVTERSVSDNQAMRSGQPKMKNKKMKSTMSDGSGKMKTKM